MITPSRLATKGPWVRSERLVAKVAKSSPQEALFPSRTLAASTLGRAASQSSLGAALQSAVSRSSHRADSGDTRGVVHDIGLSLIAASHMMQPPPPWCAALSVQVVSVKVTGIGTARMLSTVARGAKKGG